MTIKEKIIDFLRWTEKYSKTDMAYVAKGSFWWIAGKVGLFLISSVTMIVFARWLPKEDYGIYQFALSGLALFSIFTLPGIDAALIKSTAKRKEGTLELAVKEKTRWGIIGTFLSLGLSAWYFLHGNNLLAVVFLIIAAFVPLRETFPIFIAFLNGKKRFDLQAKYQIISATLSASFVIPTVFLTNNVIIIIAVFLLSHTFFDWLLYCQTKKQITNEEQDPEAIVFGKHLTLMSTLQIAAAQLDKIIIWKFLGAIPVAIYTFALLPIQKVQEILPIVPLALPKFGENAIDEQRKKGIISKFLRLFIVTIPIAAFLILIAPYFYQIFFPQYIESVSYFQALCLSVVLSPFLLLNAGLLAEIKKGALYIINTGTPLLKIILFLTLIPYFGLWGIVVAILIAELLRGLLALYFFLKI